MKMDEQDIQDLLNPTKKLTKKRRQELADEFVSTAYREELVQAIISGNKQAVLCYRKALTSALDALGADEETYWAVVDACNKKFTRRFVRASKMRDF